MNLKHTFTGALLASTVAFGASAAVLDLTAASAGLSGDVVPGLGYTMTGFPVAPNNDQDYDGLTGATPSNLGPIGSLLAFDTDGFGIIDDEISNLGDVVQSITITFSKTVFVTGFAFLDLYKDLAGTTGPGEFATMTTDFGQSVTLSFDLGVDGQPAPVCDAALGGSNPGNLGCNGYAETQFGRLRANSLTFTISDTNDAIGDADAALAAIEVAAVPVPAAGLLLLGGLGGLAALRRRKA